MKCLVFVLFSFAVFSSPTSRSSSFDELEGHLERDTWESEAWIKIPFSIPDENVLLAEEMRRRQLEVLLPEEIHRKQLKLLSAEEMHRNQIIVAFLNEIINLGGGLFRQTQFLDALRIFQYGKQLAAELKQQNLVKDFERNMEYTITALQEQAVQNSPKGNLPFFLRR